MARFDLQKYLESKQLEQSRARNGKFTSCCPFHSERHPSFSVNLETGQWLCRTTNICGQRGSGAASLVSKLDNIPWREALKLVGSAYRAPLVSYSELDEITRPKEREVAVSPSLPNCTPIGSTHNTYLNEVRRYGSGVAEAFDLRIGHGQWDGYLLLPVYDALGSYVSFTGRYTGEPDAKHPRYNGPVFPLKDYLYGEWQLRDEDRPVFVVEGQFDVMRLWSFGELALGTFGTSYTPTQIGRLVKLVGNRKIVVLFDADTLDGSLNDVRSPGARFISTLQAVGKKATLVNISTFGVKDADCFDADTWRNARMQMAPLS